MTKRSKVALGAGALLSAALVVTTALPADALTNTWLNANTHGYKTYYEPATSQQFSRTGVELQLQAEASALSQVSLEWGTHAAASSDTYQKLTGPRDNRRTSGYWRLKTASPSDPGTLKMRITILGIPSGGMRTAAKVPDSAALPSAVRPADLSDANVVLPTVTQIRSDGAIRYWQANTSDGGTALISTDGLYTSITRASAEQFTAHGISASFGDTAHPHRAVLLPAPVGAQPLEQAGLRQVSSTFFAGAASTQNKQVTVQSAEKNTSARRFAVSLVGGK